MTHRCHLITTDGKISESHASAKVDDPRVPAKLKLDLGYFYGDYWVLAVGDNYEDALIGHPSLTMLWVLSRSPTLAADRYAELTALATRQGYGIGQLEMTPQSGNP